MFIVADLVSLSSHTKIDKTKAWKPYGIIMQVKSNAECSTGAPWSILQYSWPALLKRLSFLKTYFFVFFWVTA